MDGCSNMLKTEDLQNRHQLCYNCKSTLKNQSSDKLIESSREMLSSIYKLNFLTLLSSSASSPKLVKHKKGKGKKIHDNDDHIVSKKPDLCGVCTPLLRTLYSVYCQFNALRPLDSQLTKDILALDQLISTLSLSLNKERQTNGRNNQNNNDNKNDSVSKSNHEWPSSVYSPWVKVGKRLEDIEFETLGYAPQTLGHLFEKPQPEEKTNPLKSSSARAPVSPSKSMSWTRSRSRSKVKSESKQVESNFLNKGFDDDYDDDDNYLEIQDNGHENEDEIIQVVDDLNKDEEEVDVKLFSQPLSALEPEVDSLLNEDKEDEENEVEDNDDDDEEEEEWKPPVKLKSKIKKSTTTTTFKKKRKRKKEQSSTEEVEPGGETQRKRGRKRGAQPGVKRGKYKPRTSKQKEYIRTTVLTKCPIEGCERELCHRQIKNHIRLVHDRPKSGPYVCNLPKIVNGVLDTSGELCKYTTPKRFLLTRHRATLLHVESPELMQVPCKICGSVLASQHLYNLHHYHMHTEKGRISYEQGQKKASDARKAERREVNAKGFVCQFCQVDFFTKTKLTNHQMKVHQYFGPKSKTYVCEICGKTSPDKYRLNQHVTKVHTDEKPFMCSICGNRYKTQPHLNNHMERGHTEEGRLKFNKFIRENMKRDKMIKAALAQSQSKQQQPHIPDPPPISTGQLPGSSWTLGGGEMQIQPEGSMWEGNRPEFQGLTRL